MSQKKYLHDKDLDEIQKKKLRDNALNDVCYIIALRIRNYINEKQISNKDFAKKADIGASTLSSYINAKAEMKVKYLLDISKAMNVSTDYLLGKEEFKTPDDSIKYINKITDLSEEAIENLKGFKNSGTKSYIIKIINFLIEEEYCYPGEDLIKNFSELDIYDVKEAEKKENLNKFYLNYRKKINILSKINEFFTTYMNDSEKIYITKQGILLDSQMKEGLYNQFMKLTNKDIEISNKVINEALLKELNELLKKCKDEYLKKGI